MPAPKPWSYSSLDCFVTCPRKYHAEYVLKSIPYVETPAQKKGTEMHKEFELRLAVGRPLPDYMAQHEPLMKEIEGGLGDAGLRPTIWTERKVGLNAKLEPCDFFAPDVWWRGVIDVHKVNPDKTATIVDYKTGKQHNKVRQLHLFAMYGFLTGNIEVETYFYWTETRTKTRVVLPQAQLPMILRGLVPDLKEYKEAYRDNVWPPKPNGLCKSYCGVTECEFHGNPQRRFT